MLSHFGIWVVLGRVRSGIGSSSVRSFRVSDRIRSGRVMYRVISGFRSYQVGSGIESFSVGSFQILSCIRSGRVGRFPRVRSGSVTSS
jgi:hypothetical protein